MDIFVDKNIDYMFSSTKPYTVPQQSTLPIPVIQSPFSSLDLKPI